MHNELLWFDYLLIFNVVQESLWVIFFFVLSGYALK